METDRIPARRAADEGVHVALVGRVLGSRAGHGRAERLLAETPLAVLSRFSASTLQSMAALTAAQADRLVASFALGRAVEETARKPAQPLRHPADIARLMLPLMRGLEQEVFQILLLDSKHRMRARREVSVGTLTTSLVHPREVFRDAVRLSAAAVVAVHNHPSGDPEPSAEDRQVTRRLIECGELLGIPLLDHVVIGDGRWVSLRERLEFGSAPTRSRA